MSIKPMGATQWAMLILLSLLWGGSFFFMKVASLELPVLSIVYIRVLLAALSLYGYLRVSGIDVPMAWGYWKLFLYLGLFNNILPFSLLIFGMSELGSALAAILNATTPLFTIVVAHLYTSDEKLSVQKIIGVVLGVVGVGVLMGGGKYGESWLTISDFGLFRGSTELCDCLNDWPKISRFSTRCDEYCLWTSSGVQFAVIARSVVD